MMSSFRRFGLAAVLALVAAAGFSSTVHAQYYNRARPASLPPFTVYLDPRVQQYALNTAILARAYQQVPPYAMGYNPYVNSVNYGPAFANQGYSGMPPYNYANPYSYNGYNGFYGYNGFIGASGYYNPGPYGNPYAGLGNAYYGNYVNPYSGFGIPGY
jgi:hypothetical protein